LKAEITGTITKQLKTVDAIIARFIPIFAILKIAKNTMAKIAANQPAITNTAVTLLKVFIIPYQKFIGAPHLPNYLAGFQTIAYSLNPLDIAHILCDDFASPIIIPQ
jgi:hypothetical protein